MPLAVPVLTLADANETPEKIAITVTGSDPAATNTLFRIAWNGTINTPTAWTSADSFTGNVTARKTAITPGEAWYSLRSVLGSETVYTPPVYRPITDQTAAVQTRCLNAIVTRLKSLAIPTILDEVYPIPSIDELSIGSNKCGVIRGAAPIATDNNSVRDFFEYAFLVVFTAADTLGVNSPEAKYDTWSEKARKAFHNRRLDGVAECRWCKVEPFIVPESRPELAALVRVSLIVRVTCWEVRGA